MAWQAGRSSAAKATTIYLPLRDDVRPPTIRNRSDENPCTPRKRRQCTPKIDKDNRLATLPATKARHYYKSIDIDVLRGLGPNGAAKASKQRAEYYARGHCQVCCPSSPFSTYIHTLGTQRVSERRRKIILPSSSRDKSLLGLKPKANDRIGHQSPPVIG